MITLHAGLLKHRIMIEQQVNILDEFGGEQMNWQLHRILWAHLIPLSNVVDTRTDSLIARSRYDVFFRKDKTVTVNMRIIIDGVAHMIDTIAPHRQEGFTVCRVSGEYV